MRVTFIITAITITKIRNSLIAHNVAPYQTMPSQEHRRKSIVTIITMITFSSVKSGDGLVACPQRELKLFSSWLRFADHCQAQLTLETTDGMTRPPPSGRRLQPLVAPGLDWLPSDSLQV
jgi:hypothetical protein